MGLFDKIKKEPKETKQQIRKDDPAPASGGLLEALGVSKEAAKTPKSVEEEQLLQQIQQAWQFLRGRIDKAAREYFLDKDPQMSMLRKYVEQPALGRMEEWLTSLKQQGLVWAQPKRKNSTDPQFKIIDVQKNAKGRPTRFIVRERWTDKSVFARVDENKNPIAERESEGVERVVEVTVNVIGGRDWRLASIERISE